MRFYSQYGEDAILARIFPGLTGTCVEVGANDGVTFSNSYYFEQLGWKCILVEPTPHLCAKIRDVRKSKLYACAASDAEGEAILYVVKGADVYSSLEVDSTKADRLENDSVKIVDIRVKTRRLDDILSESKVDNIDFISIDVEGHEISVLKGFSIKLWLPKIAIIEDDTDLTDTPVCRYMQEHGYVRFYRTGGNDWYASPNENQFRSLPRLLLSRKWRLTGLAKAWLPVGIRRFLTLALRTIRK